MTKLEPLQILDKSMTVTICVMVIGFLIYLFVGEILGAIIVLSGLISFCVFAILHVGCVFQKKMRENTMKKLK